MLSITGCITINVLYLKKIKMRLFYLAFLILIMFSGCKEEPQEIPEQPVEKEQDLTYLALGDSYTIGESVETDLRWPVQLVDSLRERGIAIDAPKIIARTGWTTGDLLAAMDEQLEDKQYDLVSLLIGVNNQYQGRSIEEYEEELRELFTRSIARSRTGNEGVFAVTIPDYGATPFGAARAEEIGREIKEFNDVFKRIAAEYEVEVYDITPISELAVEDETLVASDELHPSGKMYSLWVEEFVDEVAEKISSEILE